MGPNDLLDILAGVRGTDECRGIFVLKCSRIVPYKACYRLFITAQEISDVRWAIIEEWILCVGYCLRHSVWLGI